jgi:hypothetical protein
VKGNRVHLLKSRLGPGEGAVPSGYRFASKGDPGAVMRAIILARG